MLLVDLDQQGDLASDLGFAPDRGEELAFALMDERVAPPTRADVRSGLDVVPGGPELGDVAGYFGGRSGAVAEGSPRRCLVSSARSPTSTT